MRILFCDNTCPGRFGELPVRLAAGRAHEVMFLSFYPRDSVETPGVVHARLRLDRSGPEQEDDPFLAAWQKTFRLGRQAFRTFCRIRDSGFVPDVVCVTLFDGPAFFLRHAFPGAFLVSYLGALRTHGNGTEAERERRRALLEAQNFQILQSDMCFVHSGAQREAFSPLLRPRIHVQPPYVDTNFFSPGQGTLRALFPGAEAEELVIFHLKGAQRFDDWAQVVLGLLLRRPHCAVALTFGSGTHREIWEARARTLPETLRARLCLASGLNREAYRNLLRLSTAHVFPEYTRPPLQEMLESMSCESLLLMPEPDPDDELFRPGETMLPLPCTGSEARLAALCETLERGTKEDSVRRKGRAVVCERCGEAVALDRHWALVMEAFRNRKTP